MRSEFQISERSVTETSAPARQAAWIFSLPSREHLAGAEHRAIVLHDALHVEPERRGRRLALGVAEPVEAGERELGAVLGSSGCLSPGFSISAARRPAARPNTTRSISELEPSRFAPCTETQAASPSAISPGTIESGSPFDLGQDLAVIVGRDAAHVVVDGRQDRDRLLGHIDAGEDARALGNARQPLVQHLRIEMVEVQVDVVLVLADAAAFADLHRHRAADDVARGEVLGGGRVALHEALALGIDEIAAFAARALGDEAARAIDAGRMELHELHVLQRQAGAQRHRVAVAGAGVRRSGGEIGAAIAAGGQHSGLGAEPVDRSVVHLEADDAAHRALGVADEVDGEIFDEELALRLQRLAVERVQDGVAGAVGGGAGALRDALAVFGRHAAERALIDLALFGARERHAPMVELVDRGRRVAAEIFDRVLVAEPVGRP